MNFRNSKNYSDKTTLISQAYVKKYITASSFRTKNKHQPKNLFTQLPIQVPTQRNKIKFTKKRWKSDRMSVQPTNQPLVKMPYKKKTFPSNSYHTSIILYVPDINFQTIIQPLSKVNSKKNAFKYQRFNSKTTPPLKKRSL